MSPTFALLPSPLLGSLAWEPVRDALWARRLEALVVGLPDRPETADQVLAAFVAAIPSDGDVVLVPHSNAGLYAPSVAAAVRARATVFVDAAMPAGPTSARLAPPDFYAFLTALADGEGQLPPWSRWWDPADLDELFPSEEWQQRVQELEPRLPLAYFSSTVPVPDGWASQPCAYLAFGATYADEIATARERGWPVTMIEAGHLHMLHAPSRVAAEIVSLTSALGVVAGG